MAESAAFQRPDPAALGAERFDVVVVGGGITGCGVALDAASRGLRTLLLEAEDFASGTSSKSSKMVHGGLRYLNQREYRLVYDALAERQRLLRNAAHLVVPLPFLIPIFGRGGVASAATAKAYSTALWVYDLTGGLRIGRHRRLRAEDVVAHVPSLRRDRITAGFVYFDAQADDARLTLAVARSAAAHGAVVANHAPVAGLAHGPDGRVDGIVLPDGTRIAAGVVVNAGGVWSAEIAASGGEPAGISLRPAKGVHLTVRADRLACDHAVVLPVPGEKSSVFVVPWDVGRARRTGGAGRFTYIGTTDTDWTGPLASPDCTAADIARLLSVVNHWTTADLVPADVTAAWAGLRPLVEGEADARTADLSRRHRVVARPGLVTVTGGKLTTYRAMAADAVDAAVDQLGHGGPSRTRRLRLVGSAPAGNPPWRGRRRVPPPARGVPAAGGLLGVPSIGAHLRGRYGTEAAEVAALAAADADLARALVTGLPYLRAEAVWAVRREMATTLLDVLARRTRALILDREATLAAGPDVAALLAAELGWDPERTAGEVAALADVVAAERRAAAGPEAEEAPAAAPAAVPGA